MCDCLKNTEAQLREKLMGDGDVASFRPKNAELVYLILKNGGYSVKSGSVLTIPFDATWALPNGKQKETSINMIASHCPFCGAAFEPDTANSTTRTV